MAGEELVRTDENCVDPLLLKACKGRLDVPIRTGVNDLDLPSNDRSSRLSFSDQRLGNRTIWIDERGNAQSSGSSTRRDPYSHASRQARVRARRRSLLFIMFAPLC